MTDGDKIVRLCDYERLIPKWHSFPKDYITAELFFIKRDRPVTAGELTARQSQHMAELIKRYD